MIYSDHYPLILKLEMPNKRLKAIQKCYWNLRKPEGWKRYKDLSEETSKKMDSMIEDGTLKVEEIMRRIDKLQEKAKFKAFGKTKPKTERSKLRFDLKSSRGMEAEPGSSRRLDEEEEHAKEIQKRQSEMLESEINEVKMMKHGRMTKVFKMRELIAGSKKQGQE